MRSKPCRVGELFDEFIADWLQYAFLVDVHEKSEGYATHELGVSEFFCFHMDDVEFIPIKCFYEDKENIIRECKASNYH